MTLLEKRLKEYNIPAWPYQPVFDRIVVYRIPEDKAKSDKFSEDGILVKPEVVKDREEKSSPRGLVVAAGLTAMDQLKGHGIGLGDLVWLTKWTFYSHETARTTMGGVEFLFMRAGDVVGSEDLLKSMQAKKVTVVLDKDGQHKYRVDDDVIPRFDPPNFIDT